MRFLFLLLLAGCLQYTEPKDPIQQDSLWVYIEDGDKWIGKWEGKIFQFQINKDTIFYKEIK